MLQQLGGPQADEVDSDTSARPPSRPVWQPRLRNLHWLGTLGESQTCAHLARSGWRPLATSVPLSLGTARGRPGERLEVVYRRSKPLVGYNNAIDLVPSPLSYSGASESACRSVCASVTMLTGIEPSGAYVKLTWCPPCLGGESDPTLSAT